MFKCRKCKMPLQSAHEYHPYAACLMFKGCEDAEKVRTNLGDVVQDGFHEHVAQCGDFDIKTSRSWLADIPPELR